MNTKLTIEEESECSGLAYELEQIAEEVRARGMRDRERSRLREFADRLSVISERFRGLSRGAGAKGAPDRGGAPSPSSD